MANLNSVHLIGNLTRDVEVKFTPKGTAIGSFSLAINRVYTVGDSHEKKEEVTFVECSIFGKSAETLAQYAKKGDPLFVEGRLKQDQWQDKTTGDKRSKLAVVAESFQFLRMKEGGKSTGSDYADSTASQRPSRASQSADLAPNDIPY